MNQNTLPVKQKSLRSVAIISLLYAILVLFPAVFGLGGLFLIGPISLPLSLSFLIMATGIWKNKKWGINLGLAIYSLILIALLFGAVMLLANNDILSSFAPLVFIVLIPYYLVLFIAGFCIWKLWRARGFNPKGFKIIFITVISVIVCLSIISIVRHIYQSNEKISYKADFISIEKLDVGQNVDILNKMTNAIRNIEYSPIYYPNGFKKGEKNVSIEVTSIPNSDKVLGVYVDNPDPTKGVIMDKSNNILEEFQLKGGEYKRTNSIKMITKDVLLVHANVNPAEPGLFRKGLFQYDYSSKTLSNRLTDDLNTFYIFPFNVNQSLLIYYSGGDNVYNPPSEENIRLYGPEFPNGVELVHSKYPQGFIMSKYLWENSKTIYFLTSNNSLYKLTINSSTPAVLPELIK